MSLHDKWMQGAWERYPELMFTPAVISTALLARLVDEGRITRQEFDAIEFGYSYGMGRLKKMLQQKTDELELIKKEEQP